MPPKTEGFDFVNSDTTLFVTSRGHRIRCPASDRELEDWLRQQLQRFDILVFEDLLTGTMEKDSGEWYDYLRDLIEYAAFMDRYPRKRIILASDRFPSTRLCSACERLSDVSEATKTWQCRYCQRRHNRDRNAATNLKRLGLAFQNHNTADISAVFPTWETL